MARPATRERQERFIKSFDRTPGSTLDAGISRCLSRHGWSWLTDEQIADIAADMVSKERASQHLTLRNRRTWAGRAA